MLGWLIGGSGVLMAAVLWLRARGGPTTTAAALPPSALVERLSPVLAAIEGIRAAAAELSAQDLVLCAPPQRVQHFNGLAMGSGGWEETVGPGRRRFVELERAIEEVASDDVRAVAQAGFDLARLSSALVPGPNAERWRAQLLFSFEEFERALGQAPDPYR